MDAFSMLSRSVQDEALRFLYMLSLQSSPRGVILAVASGVVGAMLAALAARAQRRPPVAGPLGKAVGFATSPALSCDEDRLARCDEARSAS